MNDDRITLLARPGPAPRPDLESMELPPDAITARFAGARRRGHPGYLWPDIPVDRWQAAQAAIGTVTRSILRERVPVRLELPSGVGSRTMGVAAFTSGMGPLLGHWIEAGTVIADHDTGALLALHLDQSRKRFERAERFGIRAVHLLHAAGDVVVLKGLHTARAYFPEPGTRPMADIDLLISERSVDAAERTLRGAGFTPTTGLRRPYRRDWTTDSRRLPRSLDIDHAENPISLDLHASLARVFAGTRLVDLAPGGVSTEPWDLAGDLGRVLRQPLLTAFLALHASEELHQLRLVRLYELVTVIRRDLGRERLLWSALTELLRSTETLRFTYPALALAERLAPGTVSPDLLGNARSAATRLMRGVVDALEPETALRLHRRSVIERFMWAATPAEALRCISAAARPGQTNAAPLGRVLVERFFRVVRGRLSMRP